MVKVNEPISCSPENPGNGLRTKDNHDFYKQVRKGRSPMLQKMTLFKLVLCLYTT